MQKIVTRENLQALVSRDDGVAIHAVGRALVRIFERQTDEEQNTNETHVNNAMGFTGSDARSGCITAKYYIKHNTLLDWQMDRWLKPGSKGYARIVKYWKQLNEVANEKISA